MGTGTDPVELALAPPRPSSGLHFKKGSLPVREPGPRNVRDKGRGCNKPDFRDHLTGEVLKHFCEGGNDIEALGAG